MIMKKTFQQKIHSLCETFTFTMMFIALDYLLCQNVHEIVKFSAENTFLMWNIFTKHMRYDGRSIQLYNVVSSPWLLTPQSSTY